MMDVRESVVGEEELSTLIERLGMAYLKLEVLPGVSEGIVPWGEIEEHLRKLETSLNQKSEELEVREKQFEEKKSQACSYLSHMEAAVVAKERDFIDRVQLLKDAAVSAIGEIRPNCKPMDDTEDEVSGFHDDVSEHSASPKAKPLTELTRICERMDANGLWNSALQNKSRLSSYAGELSKALVNAPNPAQLVLDTLKVSGLTRGYTAFVIMQALTAAIGGDRPPSPEIKRQAKAVADEWKSNPGNEAVDAEAFMQLLATFSIANEFDEAELCKLALAISHSRRAPELCRAVGLTPRMPGIVEELKKSDKQIEAVRLVSAFNLGESFSPVELLETYMKHGPGGKQGDAVKEVANLKAVISCVVDCGLERAYPLDPIRKRVFQLEKSRPDRRNEQIRKARNRLSKKSRARKGRSRFRSASTTVQNVVRVASDIGVAGAPGSFLPAAPDYLAHGAQNPSSYPGVVADQVAYYYPQDGRVASNLQNAAAAGYAGYSFSLH